MSLAMLLYPPPTDRGLDEWMFHHVQHHQAIIDTIQKVKGVTLPLYQIYPFNQRHAVDWLEQHAQQHDDMDGALGIVGNDLGDVDFNNKSQADSWFFLHFTEHRDVAYALGTPNL